MVGERDCPSCDCQFAARGTSSPSRSRNCSPCEGNPLTLPVSGIQTTSTSRRDSVGQWVTPAFVTVAFGFCLFPALLKSCLYSSNISSALSFSCVHMYTLSNLKPLLSYCDELNILQLLSISRGGCACGGPSEERPQPSGKGIIRCPRSL